MAVLEYTIVTICGVVTLFGLALTVRCLLAQRRIHWLSPFTTPVDDTIKISVVIPARNEEYDIEPALRSVLRQEGVELEVIVVNDHSTDRTGELVENVMRSDSRVTVVHNPSLTPGLENPDSSNAVASGALMLIKTRVYREIGGFQEVKDQMFDDVGLARLLKNKRYLI